MARQRFVETGQAGAGESGGHFQNVAEPTPSPVLVIDRRCWHPLPVRRFCVLWILVLACLIGACGGPSAGGLSGKSAAEVIALAQAAATKEGSFHFIDQTGSGSKTQRLVGDSSADEGEQEVKGPNGDLEVRLVDSVIYVNASELVLSEAFKLTADDADVYAGKWISLQKSDAPYETVAKALAPTSEIAPYTPVANLKVGSISTIRGISVVAISGTAPNIAGAKAIATLYVSTSAPYVPVGGSLVGTGSDKNQSEVVAFTAWGEKVRPVAPSGTTPYSTLAAG